ncbi:LapA family protein [Tsukamurella ocularis]|uniref:LapA family protein n=1 Tax=Tsukamurella ocularis TaxID=1970234 RepID=UPI0039F0A1C0
MAKDEDRVRDSEETIGSPAPDVDATDAQNLPAERDAVESTADRATGAPATKQRGDTRDAYEQVKHTRSASLWSGLVGGAVILLVLLAFIVQNQQNTQITLLFWEANLPLGVSLLIAAILGALLVGSAGGLRILQLRRAAKKLRD